VKNRPLTPKFIPWRFYSSLFFVLLLVIALTARVVELSVFKRSFLQHEGDNRSLRMLNMPAYRGVISDRHGNPLAVSTTVYSIWINPKDFVATPDQLKELALLLKIPLIDLERLTQKRTKEFIYLARGVDPAQAAKIKQLTIPGLYQQEAYKRYYPEGEIAAQLIGFTNIDDKGQEGLELLYNKWLSGKPGKKQVELDRRGRVISDVQAVENKQAGNDLSLSIDRRIQYLAYRELMAGMKINAATSGTAIVLNVKTGEVLAMVNLPSFNPNNKVGQKKDFFRNRALTDTFEPGSTIKAFSIASALDSGLFKPHTIIDTYPGWMRVDHNVVRDEHDNGPISVGRILQVSSNVGTTKMILALPANQLWTMLHKMGFGEATGVNFPGEQSGSLVNRPRWGAFTLATLSFGYGISVTPLQLAHAYATLANDGLKIPVSLLKTDKEPKGEQVLNPRVARDMIDLLETVVSTKGATGHLAFIPGYRVAGKTGTSFMAGSHGGYEKHKFISSFIGMAPASHPELVVSVVIHDPKGKNHLAGYVSAPIFKKIMEGTLRILNVPPDA
jgi:cell division protein FtsI (penicillin-binding protein 3)